MADEKTTPTNSETMINNIKVKNSTGGYDIYDFYTKHSLTVTAGTTTVTFNGSGDVNGEGKETDQKIDITADVLGIVNKENLVRATGTLSSEKIVVGNDGKEVKTSEYTIDSSALGTGNTTIPTSSAVSTAIAAAKSSIDSNNKGVVHITGAETIEGPKTFAEDTTFNKAVTVGGDLIVKGKTTQLNVGTVSTSDYLIELATGRDSKTGIATPAGIVVANYDGKNSGALAFDNSGTAYVGDVKLDDSGNINTANVETTWKPLTTRDGKFTDNHIVIWSGDSIKDSGVAYNAIADTTASSSNGVTVALKNENGKIGVTVSGTAVDVAKATAGTLTFTANAATSNVASFNGSNVTLGTATSSFYGLMSAAQAKKLAGVAEGANNYVHPTDKTAHDLNFYKVANDSAGHVINAVAVTKNDITGLLYATGTAGKGKISYVDTTDHPHSLEHTELGENATYVQLPIAASGKLGLVKADSANVITINTDGMLSLDQSKITKLGTITSGIWNGSVIDVAHGGTGLSTAAKGGLLVGNDTGAMSVVKAAAKDLIAVSGDAASGYAPTWKTLKLSSTPVKVNYDKPQFSFDSAAHSLVVDWASTATTEATPTISVAFGA